MITAGFDPFRDSGEAYARKLTDAGVPTRLLRYEGVIHGFLTLLSCAKQIGQLTSPPLLCGKLLAGNRADFLGAGDQSDVDAIRLWIPVCAL